MHVIAGGRAAAGRGVDSVLPPNDLPAERALLVACILDTDKLDTAIEVLSVVGASPFFSGGHNIVWSALLALRQAGKEIDVTTVQAWLREQNELHRLGDGDLRGSQWLVELVNSEAVISHVREYARIVRDTARRRALIAVTQEVQAIAYHGGEETQALVERALDECNAIAEQSEIAENLESALDGMKAMARALQSGQASDVVRTGYTRVDGILQQGPGSVVILAARPGMGKSALAVNIALQVTAPAQEGGVRDAAVFLSLEMTRPEVWQRAACIEARIDSERLRASPPRLSPCEWDRFTRVSRDMAQRALWVDDAPGLNLVQVRAKIRRARHLALRAGARLRLCVVDYLQLMRAVSKPSKETSREQIVAECSRGLKAIAKEEGVLVLALAQLNREVERSKDKRPTLAHLRESGSIEQDADAVAFIYRDDYYDPDSGEKNIAEIIVAKQRGGRTGTVKLRWSGEYTRFDNLAEGEFEEGGAGA